MYLAPLFCSKQEDQKSFATLFGLWVEQKTLAEKTVGELPKTSLASSKVQQQPFYLRRRVWLAGGLVLAIIAILAVIYLPLILAPEAKPKIIDTPPAVEKQTVKNGERSNLPKLPQDLPPIRSIPPQQPPPVTLTSAYQQVIHWFYWLGLGLPLALGVLAYVFGWVKSRFALHRQQGKSSNPLVHIRLQPSRALPFALGDFAARFHRSRWLTTRRMNVAKTVAKTIQQGGLLSPVYRTRPVQPEYLVLVDRPANSDQLTALADTLVQRLRAENLHVSHYYFRGDPRYCYREQGQHTQAESLTSLQSQHPDARLLIIGDAKGLYSGLNQKLVDWMPLFEPWRLRVWLTNRPQPWGYQENQLAQAGFVVSTLDSHALKAVGDWLQTMNQLPEIFHIFNQEIVLGAGTTETNVVSFLKRIVANQCCRNLAGKDDNRN
jgi:hypothetical protein